MSERRPPRALTVARPDGATIHVLVTGPSEGGLSARIPLLLVHGWAGSAGTWLANLGGVDELFRVVVPDLRGHGQSGPGSSWSTTGGSTDDVLSAMVDDLVAVLDDLGLTTCIAVGHSMGGQVVARLADAHPERVDGTVVIDPSYGNAAIVNADVMADRARLLRVGTPAVLDDLDGGLARIASTPLQQMLRVDAARANVAVLADAGRDQYVAATSYGRIDRTRELLARRTRPALALYSNARSATTERELSVGTAIEPTVETWDGMSHWLHLEQPERFASVLTDWYDRTFRTRP